jgi:hypothetical protein
MVDGSRSCPRGFIRRKGYTRKNTGTHVKSACIRSTSPYSTKPTNTRKRQTMRLGRIIGTKKACPPGQIPRQAYVRKISTNISRRGYIKKIRKSGKTIRVYPRAKRTFVKSTCIKDLGKKGKGAPVIGPLRKGELSKHGYSYKLPETSRHASLERAVREYGALSTYRKLNAVAKLSTRVNPTAASAFAADRNWVRSTYGVSGELKAF